MQFLFCCLLAVEHETARIQDFGSEYWNWFRDHEIFAKSLAGKFKFSSKKEA